MDQSTYQTPANRMVGLELKDGWHVANALLTGKKGGGTGGNFSVSYLVERGKEKAFLKAFDIHKALTAAPPNSAMQVLAKMTDEYRFETTLHEICASKRMKRVVQILGYGEIDVPLQQGESSSVVPYIIMEHADGGDVRGYLNRQSLVDICFKIKFLKDVALGLQQLHSAHIAHQDLKPSNVMIFESHSTAKIGDLGRAARMGATGQFDGLVIAGDRGYAPPEQLYGVVLSHWADRRLRCDLYQFGSLCYFLFAGTTINAKIRQSLDANIAPPIWGGQMTTYEMSLPYWVGLFNDCISELDKVLPDWLFGDVSDLIRQCSHPDYKLRGHPKALQISAKMLGVDRMVSKLDFMYAKAQINVRIIK